MADLRALLEGLGPTGVETYIQSGNAIFSSTATPGRLASRIEAAFETQFGFRSDVVLRTLPQWHAAIAACPFRAETADPRSVHLGFFKGTPDPARLAALQTMASGRDAIEVTAREVILHLPDGLARSRLANALISRNLGTPITLRNWRTVQILAEMAQQPD